MKGVRRFQTRGKLAPRFIGPFPVMSRVGTVAYQLELPPELSDVHNVFHVSQLRRCISSPEQKTAMAELELAKDLTYEDRPLRILDEVERVTRSKTRKISRFSGSITQSQNPRGNGKSFSRNIILNGFP